VTKLRNPIQDHIAIVGVGSTGFRRSVEGRSRDSLCAEAALAAIADAGLDRADIDGLVGSAPPPNVMASILDIDDVQHYSGPRVPIGFSVVDAANAVFSGSADAVLVYHSVYRTPAISNSAAKDPFRRGLGFAGNIPPAPSRIDPESITGAPGYAAWASRYLHEYGVDRDAFARIAINSRSNAAANPLAAMRDPMTFDDYYAARMVREPLGLFDMDVPVDGADAFVITTAERARDLPHRPVLVHAMATGLTARNAEDQIDGLHHHGQHVVVDRLRRRSEVWLPDIDVYYPYDGFTVIAASWFENTGWCGPGEAGDFLTANWNPSRSHIQINGRVGVNTHGGALSEGGTQGSGHLREAVTQLRGEAGERQVDNAHHALITPGGFFYNAQGIILRAGS
jgi:acetyl-CoA acetyltransferase